MMSTYSILFLLIVSTALSVNGTVTKNNDDEIIALVRDEIKKLTETIIVHVATLKADVLEELNKIQDFALTMISSTKDIFEELRNSEYKTVNKLAQVAINKGLDPKSCIGDNFDKMQNLSNQTQNSVTICIKDHEAGVADGAGIAAEKLNKFFDIPDILKEKLIKCDKDQLCTNKVLAEVDNATAKLVSDGLKIVRDFLTILKELSDDVRNCTLVPVDNGIDEIIKMGTDVKTCLNKLIQ